MKAKTINLQLVKNIGNYESVRIGGEWSVEKGDDINECMSKACDELNEAFAVLREADKLKAERTAEEKAIAEARSTGKEFLQWGTPKMKQVIEAVMQGRADLDKVKEYYTLTNDTEKMINFAVTLNTARNINN